MNRILSRMTGLVLLLACAGANAEWSGNVGWTSEYIFRGISQSDSSAYVGVDYESQGFYAGTWAADVGQGSEVDFYVGYAGGLGDSFSYQVGNCFQTFANSLC